MKNIKYLSYYQQLGLNISKYRKLRKLTQMELSEKANLSRTHISNIEASNYPTKISLDALFTIAEVLEIEPKLLFDFHNI